MKKSKVITILCLLFIIGVFFTICSNTYTNNIKSNNKNIILAAAVRPDNEGGGTAAKYSISLENLSLLKDVTSCENSTRMLVKVISSTGSTKNVYACVFNDRNQQATAACPAYYSSIVSQVVYEINNSGVALANFCQSNDINSGNQNNTQNGNQSGSTNNSGTSGNTGNSGTTNNQSSSNEENNENNSISGGGNDTGTTIIDDSEPRLHYDNMCESEGFKTASKIAGVIILFAKWIAPLILMILGMIDFGKAIISDNDKSLSDATKVFIKRMVIAIVIPFIPGLLFYLINFVIGEEVSGIKIEFGDCTKCLEHPLDKEKCKIDLHDYNNQK